MFAGVTPVAANATSAVALWPGSISSAIAHRPEIVTGRRWLVSLGGVSLLGGLVGAFLLIRPSDSGFLRLLPWLMLLAAATFTFGGRVRPATAAPHLAVVVLIQFAISIYGGY